MNATNQVRTFLVRSSGPIFSNKVILLLQVHRRPEVLCWGGAGLFPEAPTRHTAMTRGLACNAAGPHRVKIWWGLSYVVRDAAIRYAYCAGSPFETQISSRSVVGMARLVHDCGSREPEAAGIRVKFRFGLHGGASWMSSWRRCCE
jgi:hypothetical protein